MVSGLIFDSNTVSEILIQSYFRKAKVIVADSYNVQVNVFYLVRLHEPDYIVVDFELYSSNIYDIISGVRGINPLCEIIIVANKLKKSHKVLLKERKIKYIFERPYVDVEFIRLFNTLTYN